MLLLPTSMCQRADICDTQVIDATKKEKLGILRWFFWVACLVVAVLSLLPGDLLQNRVFNWWDKAQHASAFMVLGLLGLRAYQACAFRVVVGLLAFGAAIEIAQAASGWRFGDWQDWLADAVGVLGAYCLYRVGQRSSIDFLRL